MEGVTLSRAVQLALRPALALFLGIRTRIPADQALALTPGNVADITMAVPMLEALAPTMWLVADKAYDADRLRNWLKHKGIEAVIPGRAARTSVYPINRAAHRRRNIIERMFGRL
jgi:IS5 family transposase